MEALASFIANEELMVKFLSATLIIGAVVLILLLISSVLSIYKAIPGGFFVLNGVLICACMFIFTGYTPGGASLSFGPNGTFFEVGIYIIGFSCIFLGQVKLALSTLLKEKEHD